MSDPTQRLLSSFVGAEEEPIVETPAWALGGGSPARSWNPGARSTESGSGSEESRAASHTGPSAVELDVDEAALAALYDETRAAAHEEGYQAGCEEGRIAGEEAGQVAVEEELATLGSIRAQLEAELSSLTALRRNLLRDAEIDCVELALRVGKRLASDAQLGSTSWVEPLVRAASLALTHGDRVVCHVGIDLADRLERSGAVIDLEGAVIERNHDLGPLDVVVETESARVNAGIEARFDELREAILARVARVPVDETTP